VSSMVGSRPTRLREPWLWLLSWGERGNGTPGISNRGDEGDLLSLLFSSGSRGLAEAKIELSGKTVVVASAASKQRVADGDVENFMVINE